MPTTLAADPDGVYDHGTKFVEHGARLVAHWAGFGDLPSMRITSWRSAHTSRLADGVRSRYAGWKVGMMGIEPL